jgi:ABC-type sugar transport system permease subunit
MVKGGLGKMKKKGQVQTLAPAILSLVFAAVVLVFGLVISQELRDTQTAGSDAFNAANDTLVGLATFADFWEIIVLAIVITVVIGLLLVVFGGRGRR